jgi:hypothetical protein
LGSKAGEEVQLRLVRNQVQTNNRAYNTKILSFKQKKEIGHKTKKHNITSKEILFSQTFLEKKKTPRYSPTPIIKPKDILTSGGKN